MSAKTPVNRAVFKFGEGCDSDFPCEDLFVSAIRESVVDPSTFVDNTSHVLLLFVP